MQYHIASHLESGIEKQQDAIAKLSQAAQKLLETQKAPKVLVR